MKCVKCPLFSSWNNENDKGEDCGLFGDGWDNPLQYEDKNGTIIGCYVDSNYIKRRNKEYCEYLRQMAEDCLELLGEPPKEEEDGN